MTRRKLLGSVFACMAAPLLPAMPALREPANWHLGRVRIIPDFQGWDITGCHTIEVTWTYPASDAA